MPRDPFDRAVNLLKQSRHAVALTGAGVSTESGIPDFRGRGGLWSRYDPIEYGTIGAFRENPAKVWQMLAGLLEIVDAEPNPGHRGLAFLEEQGLLAGIITQNIDGLHQKGGSRNVVEFHGSLETFTCLACGAGYSLAEVKKGVLPPCCGSCGAIIKPDIVFFDERIPDGVLAGSRELLAGADLLLVIGTSCQVPPAAHIPYSVNARGGTILEINREPVLGRMAAVTLQGSFSSIMEKLVAGI